MSTVKLLKDCGHGKRGETISVPFAKGREMLKDGLGIYPEEIGGTKSALPETPEQIKLRKENEALKKRLEEQQEQIDRLLAAPHAAAPAIVQTTKK